MDTISIYYNCGVIYMYCITQKKVCDYVDINHRSIDCNYQEIMGKTYTSCEYGVEDFESIIEKTFTDKDYEEFAKQILIYENNKYIRDRIRIILDSCYSKRDEQSAMEDIEKVFFKQYFLWIMRKKKKGTT